MNLIKLFFKIQYRFFKPRWDTGITPPEVVELVERGVAHGKRALDLGCGTGTNAIYLAKHGFQVVGVDFAKEAIAQARDKAKQARAAVEFHVADVTALVALGMRGPYDFVLDIGCFHGIERTRRIDYARQVTRLTRTGARFMLYAFAPRRFLSREIGASAEDVKRAFTYGSAWRIARIEESTENGKMTSAWYWLVRQ